PSRSSGAPSTTTSTSASSPRPSTTSRPRWPAAPPAAGEGPL
ncbi:MAG: hypothetical protein AVDCRST_MAG12-486, partial [uncultured Rubrobacteraceae bacterium]